MGLFGTSTKTEEPISFGFNNARLVLGKFPFSHRFLYEEHWFFGFRYAQLDSGLPCIHFVGVTQLL